MSPKTESDNQEEKEELTEAEMEFVTTVFKSFETGLREATIYPKDLLSAMKMLGLNPMEQDIMDLCNTVPKNGLIYFPDFCDIVCKRWREVNEEVFRQNMFKIFCGTEPFPELYRAKKYKFNDNFFSKKDFRHIMLNLPVEVPLEDIDMMFHYADADGDGKISWKEFQTMINPPKPPEPPKPSLSDLASRVKEKTATKVIIKEEIKEAEFDQQPLSVATVVDTVSSNCAEASWSSVPLITGTPT